MRDFVWWSGLKTIDARRGLAIIEASRFEQEGVTYYSIAKDQRGSASGVHLLPIYDEYLVSYRDRVAVPHGPSVDPPRFRRSCRSGTRWSSTARSPGHGVPSQDDEGPVVVVTAMRRLSRAERNGVEAAIARYGHFLGVPVAASVTSG